MKQKIVTVICAVLSLTIFVSAFHVTGVDRQVAEEPSAQPQYMSMEDVGRIVNALHTKPLIPDAPSLTLDMAVELQPPAPTPEPSHPFTAEEVVMLAKTIGAEALVVPSKARQAAVGWCALNRLDDGRFGATLAEVLSKPFQFAYREDAEVYPGMLELAEDVLCRWYAEKLGGTDVGRTLPSEYLYFDGDGWENHFRITQYADQEWDWSLPDPYSEG